MRFYAYAFAAGALVLGACGGGDKKAADSTAAMTPAADTTAAMTAPAGTQTTAAGSATMAPITGKTVEVKMIGDAKGYRFEPANVTVAKGDGVKFVMESGGPHNVSFNAEGIPAGATPQLNANMSDKMAELSSNMYSNPGQSVTVSFANVPAGTYNYNCTPHLAMGMKGVITVQ